MSQTAITSYFISRKRAASDDISNSKSKVPHIEKNEDNRLSRKTQLIEKIDEDIKNEDVKKSSVPIPKSLPQLRSQESTVFEKKVNCINIAKNNGFSKSQVTSSARKELNLGDIRKTLAGSARLAEIKARADRLIKGIQELKEAGEKKNLKEFKSINVVELSSSAEKSQIPTKFVLPKKEAPVPQEKSLISPRKIIVSPIKSPIKIPAYIKHHSLATNTTTLPLPHQYRLLSEIFRGLETVAAALFNRNEEITFAKVKPSVQTMLKRTFNERHLAQIKHIVPDFYNFEVRKRKTFSASSHKDTYEMIIIPNIPKHFKIMNPTVLIERRRYFSDTLLQHVKKFHSQYLLTLDPPMTIPDDKLIRWHPKFELEKLPEIECAKLPEMPNTEKITTAQDVLAKAREMLKCNKKMGKALEKLAQAKALTEDEKNVTGFNASASTAATSEINNKPTTNNMILNPALRNLPASLLEKVKARQAAKALEAMTRSSVEDQQKYAMYSRLSDLVKILRNIFVSEKKNVLALGIILSKLESSYEANISASVLQKDIELLVEKVPELVKLHYIGNNMYLRFDKKTDLKEITSKLEGMASKFRHE